MTLTLMILGCVNAMNSTIEINGIDFKIPPKYQGGETGLDMYKLDNTFSIRCVDDNIAQAIGLWAVEKDFSHELEIENHPVRHYCQYNQYVNGNHSHAYFASGNSVYEISWTGAEIDGEIENLIKNTPKSEINDDAFYDALDKSIDIYKELKKEKLNEDAMYNYLEAKYQSQQKQTSPEDTSFKEILLTHNFI